MIKMDALRSCYESLELLDPQTYVQSGNVVFRTREKNLVRLARRIEDGIEETFGFRPDVILRTAAEMRDVIARHPFAARKDLHPGKMIVSFFPADPGAEAREKVHQMETDPEELRMDGRELYVYFPNGMGRSKLQFPAIEKILKARGTARNWNSVTKLLEMAEKLEKP